METFLNSRVLSSALPEGPGSRGAHPGEGPVHWGVQAAVWQRPQWPLWEHDLPHQGRGGVRAGLPAQRLVRSAVRWQLCEALTQKTKLKSQFVSFFLTLKKNLAANVFFLQSVQLRETGYIRVFFPFFWNWDCAHVITNSQMCWNNPNFYFCLLTLLGQ